MAGLANEDGAIGNIGTQTLEKNGEKGTVYLSKKTDIYDPSQKLPKSQKMMKSQKLSEFHSEYLKDSKVGEKIQKYYNILDEASLKAQYIFVENGKGLSSETLMDSWNLGSLKTILLDSLKKKGDKIPGVTSPYSYLGYEFSIFPWHCEDANLFAISFLHKGAPKVWFAVPRNGKEKFEKEMETLYPDLAKECEGFLSHKYCVVNPQHFQNKNIPVNKIVQKENEFVLVGPGVYHTGFNTGNNHAEATNFAMEWGIGEIQNYKNCTCSLSKDQISVKDQLDLTSISTQFENLLKNSPDNVYIPHDGSIST